MDTTDIPVPAPTPAFRDFDLSDYASGDILVARERLHTGGLGPTEYLVRLIWYTEYRPMLAILGVRNRPIDSNSNSYWFSEPAHFSVRPLGPGETWTTTYSARR